MPRVRHRARRRPARRRTALAEAPAKAAPAVRPVFLWAALAAIVLYALSRTKRGEAAVSSAFDAVSSAIDRLLRNEGGFVISAAENGGAVNFGIDLATLQAIRPGSTVDDLRALSADDARAIYREYYVTRPGFDQLPPDLIAQVVDISANSGPGQAARLLQRALNDVGQSVAVDGAAGPATRAAAFAAVATVGAARVNDALVDERAAFYRGLAASNPAKYGASLSDWLTRAESYRV